jgi:hypothetical protein
MTEHEQYLNLERDFQDLNKNINHCRSSKSLMLNKLLPYLLIARESMLDKMNKMKVKTLQELIQYHCDLNSDASDAELNNDYEELRDIDDRMKSVESEMLKRYNYTM